jgi:hypothetical protein
MLRTVVKSVALISLAFAFVGCGEEGNDAPRQDARQDDAFVIAMPDEFTSIAARCFGTDMVYGARNTNGRAIAVSPSHPWCADGVLTAEETER